MIKQTLAATIFAAGTLIGGAAMAQQVQTMGPCATSSAQVATSRAGGYIGDGGHVGDDGYVGPRLPGVDVTTETATACRSSSNTSPTYSSRQTTWQSPIGGAPSNATRGETYTFALNDLYSNGFHGVHHLWMQDGKVAARAVTPYGAPRVVSVNPDNGEITLG